MYVSRKSWNSRLRRAVARRVLAGAQVVTLKTFGLEVTGMRKWLDIVEHVVPIVISYKMNSIYKRNVS